MFLDYFSLFLLLLSLTMVFFLFIYIHDLPHKVAKQREHPHEEAIHIACWLSLITLHAMWPLVFTWAVSHKKQTHPPTPGAAPGTNGELDGRFAALEQRLQKLESTTK
jgi:Na+/H+ antiporter NhaD/arsenite permease-like protein